MAAKQKPSRAATMSSKTKTQAKGSKQRGSNTLGPNRRPGADRCTRPRKLPKIKLADWSQSEPAILRKLGNRELVFQNLHRIVCDNFLSEPNRALLDLADKEYSWSSLHA
jgi:hypothetical protein